MCGIAGIIQKRNQSNKDYVSTLEMMLEVQKHRGPDGRGTEVISMGDLKCYLGHNRLSILDLSVRGLQPMQTSDGSITITFNGEIYNANDFRSDLLARGYEFRSTTDTEVLLFLYSEYGIEYVLNHIRGMFAFCIVDSRNDVIFFARDCFGEKPFYYYQNNDNLFFASEVKVFYKCDEFVPQLNEEVVDEYFMYRYVSGEDTLLKGVKQLPPGCFMKYSCGGIEINRYYTQNVKKKKYFKNKAKRLLSNELECSVKEQLYSDVPVGVMLSGGIDSSLVAKFASNHNKQIQTFSVIFEDEKYSEEPYLDYVADILSLNKNKYPMNAMDFIDNVKRCTYHMDFPINHPNSLGVYLLTNCAKEKVTVLIGGEGADELLGGYVNFTYHETEKVLRGTPCYDKLFARKFKRFLNRNTSQEENVVLFTAYGDEDSFRKLRPNGDINRVIEKRLKLYKSKRGSFFDQLSQYYMDTYLVDILNRVDKMSMANSMEMRCPFLSRKLVDNVRSVKSRLYVRPSYLKSKVSKNGKSLLKEISKSFFGKDFTYRDKMGWPLPLKDFFMEKSMASYIENKLIPGMELRNVVNTEQVRMWWNNLESLTALEVETLWISIAFEIWAEMFLDNEFSF